MHNDIIKHSQRFTKHMSFLLFNFLFIFSAVFAQQDDDIPPLEVVLDPPHQTGNLPQADFAIKFTFTEPIKLAPEGIEKSIIIKQGEADKLKFACNNQTIRFGTEANNNLAMIFIGPGLQPNLEHSVFLPQECFESATSLADIGERKFMFMDFEASFFSVGTGLVNDYTSPVLWKEFLVPSRTALNDGDNVTFYFSEKVGIGRQGNAYLYSTLDKVNYALVKTIPSDSSSEFIFSDNAVTFASENPLPKGLEYSITWDSAFFIDAAGNCVSELLDKSIVTFRRSTKILTDGSGFTDGGVHPVSGSSVFSHHKFIIEFEDPVMLNPLSTLDFCYSTTKADCCPNMAQVSLSDCHIAPEATSGQLIICPMPTMYISKIYFVRIPADAFTFFDGVFCDENGEYEHRYKIVQTTDRDGSAVMKMINTFETGNKNYLSGRPTFEMWFQKPIRVYDIIQFSSDLGHVINTTIDVLKDNVLVRVTPNEDLRSAQKYTITIPNMAIRDEYNESSYMFAESYVVTSGAICSQTYPVPNDPVTGYLDKTTGFSITCDREPRLSEDSTNRKLYLDRVVSSVLNTVETTSISLENMDEIKIQDKNWIFVPKIPLQPASDYTVRFPAESVRYLQNDFTFSFKTRTEDRVPPIGLFFSPASATELILEQMNQQVFEITFSESVFVCDYYEDKAFNLCADPACSEVLIRIPLDLCDFSEVENEPCYYPGFGDAEDFTVISLYPAGHSEGVVNAWATAGQRYYVKMDNMLLCDAQAGNPVRRSASIGTYWVKVHEDNVKPALNIDVSASTPPQYSAIGAEGSETDLSSNNVLLRLSEKIKPSTNLGKISLARGVFREYGPLLTGEPQEQGGEQHSRRQALYLEFDQAVKAGSGNIEIVDKTMHLAGLAAESIAQTIDPRQVHYVTKPDGSGMAILPSSTLDQDGNEWLQNGRTYFIRAPKEAFVNLDGIAMASDIETINTNFWQIGASGVDDGFPEVVATSFGAFSQAVSSGACAPRHITEIDVYWKEQVTPGDGSFEIRKCKTEKCLVGDFETIKAVHVSNTEKVTIAGTGDFSDVAAPAKILSKSTVIFDLELDILDITGDEYYRFYVESGIIRDLKTEEAGMNSFYHVDFRVCAVNVIPDGSDSYVQIVHPALTVGASLMTATVPANSVVDLVGNGNALFQYSFSTDAKGPQLDPSCSYPSPSDSATTWSAATVWVLCFTEDIQAGDGGTIDIKYTDKDTTLVIKLFNGGLTSYSVVGNKMFLDNRQGTAPAYTAQTSAGHWIEFANNCVIKDLLGNCMKQTLDTRNYDNNLNSYTFPNIAADDTTAPQVVFWTPGHGSSIAQQASSADTICGIKFHFGERIILNPDGPKNIIFHDCGTDSACSDAELAEDGLVVPEANLLVGDNTALNGMYGELSFNCAEAFSDYLFSGKYYQVKLPANLVKEVAGNTLTAPSADIVYNFHVTAPGTSPNDVANTDTSKPVLAYRYPPIGETPIGTILGLYFSEDVIVDSNKKVEIYGDSAGDKSTYAKLSDLATDCNVDLSAAALSHGRYVSIDLSRQVSIDADGLGLAYGESVYATFEQGLVKDMSGDNVWDGINDAEWRFTVADLDTNPPTFVAELLDKPTRRDGKLVLYFDESITFTDTGKQLTTISFADELGSMSELSCNNPDELQCDMVRHTLTITLGNGGEWSAGTSYDLTIPKEAVADLSDNLLIEDVQYNGALVAFAVSSDVTLPTVEILPAPHPSGAELQPHDSIQLLWAEDVSPQNNKVITLHSEATCADDSVVESWTVTDLPFLDYVVESANKKSIPLTPHNLLIPSKKYYLKIAAGSVEDASGNLNIELGNCNGDPIIVSTTKDTTKPNFLGWSISNSESAQEITAGQVMDLYFSEPVVAGADATKKIQLVTFADAGNNAALAFGTPAISYDKNVVRMTTTTALTPDAGYQLKADDYCVQDIFGNGFQVGVTNTAIQGANTGQTFSTKSIADTIQPKIVDADTSTTAFEPTAGTYPASGETSVFPFHGEKSVSPSSMIEVRFDEVVQKGTGTITISDLTQTKVISIDVESDAVKFFASKMYIFPPEDIPECTKVTVIVPESAAVDGGRNSIDASTKLGLNMYEFTSLCADRTQPLLSGNSGNSFATSEENGDLATPFDPPNGAVNVNHRTNIVLSFSEDVKPSKSAEMITITKSSDNSQMQLAANDITKVQCVGSSCVIHPTSGTGPEFNLLAADNSYSISFGRSTFLDLHDNPLEAMHIGSLSFSTAIEDSFAPSVLSTYPYDNQVGVSVKPMITMQFSEHIFPVKEEKVVIRQNGDIFAELLLRNVHKAIGRVTFRGNVIVIELQNEFSFGSLIEVSLETGTYTDFASNALPATSFSFTTATSAFTELVENNKAELLADNLLLPGRSHFGTVLFKGDIYVLGGLGRDQAVQSDVYKSSDRGLSFEQLTPTTQATSMGLRYGANHFVATSEKIYAMGGSCYGDGGYLPDITNEKVDLDDNNFMHSSDGKNFYPVFSTMDRKKTIQIDRKTGQLIDGMDFPFWTCGQSVLVVGGWQLYVLGGGTGKILTTLTKEATVWEIINSEVPFDCYSPDRTTCTTQSSHPLAARRPRYEFTAAVTSNADMYVFGGHSGMVGLDYESAVVFTDAWVSKDSGVYWESLTANLDKDMYFRIPILMEGAPEEPPSSGPPLGPSFAMTSDDTIFMFGGHKHKQTLTVSSELWKTRSLITDTTSPMDPLLYDPPKQIGALADEGLAKLNSKIRIFFNEHVKRVGGDIPPATMEEALNFGLQTKNCEYHCQGIKLLIGDDKVLADGTVSIHRGMVTIHPAVALPPDSLVEVTISIGYLADVSDNVYLNFPKYEFRTVNDVTKPNPVCVFAKTSLGKVVPYTSILFKFAESFEFVSGDFSFTPKYPTGYSLTLSYDDCMKVSDNIFCELPKDKEFTEGMEYSAQIPAGAFVDNSGQYSDELICTFETMSGSSANNHVSADSEIANFTGAAVIGIGNPADIVPPTVLDFHPQNQSSDGFLRYSDNRIVMEFSEDVYVDTGVAGAISLHKEDGTAIATNNQAHSDADSNLNLIDLTITSGVGDSKLMISMSTLNHTSQYTGKIHLRIDNCVIKDVAGHCFFGLDQGDFWFTALNGEVDDAIPKPVAFYPDRSSTVTGDLSHMMVVFDVPIARKTMGLLAHFILMVGGIQRIMNLQSTAFDFLESPAIVKIKLAPDYLETFPGPAWLKLPAGYVEDRAGNKFVGFGVPTDADFDENADNFFMFNVVNKDVLKPTVSIETAYPPKEIEFEFADGNKIVPDYLLPTTTVLHFTFSEVVKPISGSSISLTPKFDSPTQVYDIEDTDVVNFVGNSLIIQPPFLMSGEFYQLTFGNTTIADLSGNLMDAQVVSNTTDTQKYGFSTSALINFEKMDWGVTNGWGIRSGFGMLTMEDNSIMMLGGVNGTELLTDVWEMKTNRETHCHASESPLSLCSQLPCSGKEVKDAGDLRTPFSDGDRTANVEIWKVPSQGGKSCSSQVARDDGAFDCFKGSVYSDVDGGKWLSVPEAGDCKFSETAMETVLSSRTEPCQCPACIKGPVVIEGIDIANMQDYDYVKDYTYVSGAGRRTSKPLLCDKNVTIATATADVPTLGYNASGPFTCNVQANDWIAAWDGSGESTNGIDFPICEPIPCFSPPEAITQQYSTDCLEAFIEEDPQCQYHTYAPNGPTGYCLSGLAGEITDSSLTSTCTVYCNPGYTPDMRQFRCQLGVFTQIPTCNKNECDALGPNTITNASVSCLVGDSRFEDNCTVTCEDGFEIDGVGTVSSHKCDVSFSGKRESPVRWTPGLPHCKRKTCPDLEVQKIATNVVDMSDCWYRVLGDTCRVLCKPGHGPGGINGKAAFTCSVKKEDTETGVGFVGDTCSKLSCGDPPVVNNGGYVCTEGDHRLGDICTSLCNPLYIGGGDLHCVISPEDDYTVVWNNSVSCAPAACNLPPVIPNGNPEKMAACQGTPHGQACDMNCADGYILAGSNEVYCDFGTFKYLPLCAPAGRDTREEVVISGYLIFSSTSDENLQGYESSKDFLDSVHRAFFVMLQPHVEKMSDIVLKPGAMLKGAARRLAVIDLYSIKFDYEIQLGANDPSTLEDGQTDLQQMNIQAQADAMQSNPTMFMRQLKRELDSVGLPIPQDFSTYVGDTQVNPIIALVPVAEDGFVLTTPIIIAIAGSVVGALLLAIRCYFFQKKRRRRRLAKLHAMERGSSEDWEP